MSRVLFLSMDEGDVVARCRSEAIGISTLETLPAGGTRLVCMSVNGAEVMRAKLKSKLIKGTVERADFRPRTPLW